MNHCDETEVLNEYLVEVEELSNSSHEVKIIYLLILGLKDSRTIYKSNRLSLDFLLQFSVVRKFDGKIDKQNSPLDGVIKFNPICLSPVPPSFPADLDACKKYLKENEGIGIYSNGRHIFILPGF